MFDLKEQRASSKSLFVTFFLPTKYKMSNTQYREKRLIMSGTKEMISKLHSLQSSNSIKKKHCLTTVSF